jgi:hypothetical protein
LIEIEKMSVDQLAGAFVMIAGAIGSLLLVIWQSKCHCKMNLCYIFSCERRPPNEEEMKGLKDQAKKQNEKLKKMKEDKQEDGSKIDPDEKLQRKDSMIISELTKDSDMPNKQESSYP